MTFQTEYFRRQLDLKITGIKNLMKYEPDKNDLKHVSVTICSGGWKGFELKWEK